MLAVVCENLLPLSVSIVLIWSFVKHIQIIFVDFKIIVVCIVVLSKVVVPLGAFMH